MSKLENELPLSGLLPSDSTRPLVLATATVTQLAPVPEYDRGGKYRASPAYVQGEGKSKESASLKWRPDEEIEPGEEPEWSEIPGAPDAVIADTWWAGVWPLRSEGDRRQPALVCSLDAAGGVLTTERKDLSWALTEPGERHFLIHRGQSMLFTGPKDLAHPACELELHLTAEYASEPAGTTSSRSWRTDYLDSGATFVEVVFPEEGHYTVRAQARLKPCFGGGLVREVGPTRVHVIKKRAVETVAYWWGDTKPTEWWEWALIGAQMRFSQGGWTHLVPSSSARWILYKNPTPGSWSKWAQYSIDPGEKANPPANNPFDPTTWLTWILVDDRPLLWWGPKLGTGWNKGCFYAKYNDGVSPKPLVLEWDEGDQVTVSGVPPRPTIRLWTSETFTCAWPTIEVYYRFIGVDLLPGGVLPPGTPTPVPPGTKLNLYPDDAITTTTANAFNEVSEKVYPVNEIGNSGQGRRHLVIWQNKIDVLWPDEGTTPPAAGQGEHPFTNETSETRGMICGLAIAHELAHTYGCNDVDGAEATGNVMSGSVRFILPQLKKKGLSFSMGDMEKILKKVR